MGKFSQKNFINALLTLALCLLIVTGYFTYKQTQRLFNANAMVLHTYQVIGKANQTLLSLTQAELLVRNYLVSNDKQAIKDLPKMVTAAENNASTIRQLTLDNPHQQHRLDQIQPLLVVEGNMLQQIAHDYSQMHKQAILPETVQAKENQLTGNIKKIINDITNEELSLLEQRNIASQNDAVRTNMMLIAAVGLSVLLLLMSFILLNYQLKRRLHAEIKGQELENRLKKIIDGSKDLIAALDLDLTFIAFNKAYETKFQQLFGKELTQGTHLQAALANYAKKDEIINLWKRALRGEEFSIISQLAGADNKDQHFYEITFSAIHGSNNQLIGASHIMRDVTERVKVEKLKDEFISVISHELRTPLTSIRGALGILLGGNLEKFDEKTIKMLRIAEHNNERLINLINDILDVENIEAGESNLKLSTIDLNKLAEDSITSNRVFNDKLGSTLVLKKASNHVLVKGDFERLKLVITHLISNAIKFSPEGSQVQVSIVDRGSLARVVVVDHGEGIPEDFQKNLFKKFAQADASATRKIGGVGLGLSLCKSIIEKHHGKIGYTTKLNEGSTFYFDLPMM
ncbi:MAG: ATP-binding protein [Gammaproteobacteria bacterium]